MLGENLLMAKRIHMLPRGKNSTISDLIEKHFSTKTFTLQIGAQLHISKNRPRRRSYMIIIISNL